VLLAARVSVLEDVAGFVLNDAVTPLGKPEADRLTLLLKPFSSVTVIVLIPLAACATLRLVGDSERPSRRPLRSRYRTSKICSSGSRVRRPQTATRPECRARHRLSWPVLWRGPDKWRALRAHPKRGTKSTQSKATTQGDAEQARDVKAGAVRSAKHCGAFPFQVHYC
jgi:hypothetical protein